MVVAALIQLAVAAPIGALFGAAYGTSIRIGYEIIFPALFKDTDMKPGAQGVLDSMEKLFTGIGGLEAQKFGINQGIKNALKAIDADTELTELIKKNSNLDTQVITVNLSGSSTQASSGQSQSSLSDIETVPDTTGGLADRHRAVREILSGKTDAIEFAKASATYSSLFIAFEKENGRVTDEQAARLTNVNTNTNVRIWFVEWNFNWFTHSLRATLIKRATSQTTITKTDVGDVIQKTPNQLLQLFGGKSKQTLEMGLLQSKTNVFHWKKSLATKLSVDQKSSAALTSIKLLKAEILKHLQRIKDISDELKRRNS